MKHAGALAAAVILALAAQAGAATYRVGPGEKIARISEVVDKLAPGDLVEVTGDISDSFATTKSGTAEEPITIRGVKGKRPKIDFAGAQNGITTRADHYSFENLEFTGAAYRGIFQISGGITIRDCYFHHNHNGIMGADDPNVGDILIEFSEFAHNGSGVYAHQMYLASWKPGATATVQFNYIHDSDGGANIKTRMPHNIIRYNWIENAANYELDIVDSDAGPEGLRPMDTEFIGNVVISDARGNRHHQINLGSDQPRSPGTEGTYTIANNTLITYADKGPDWNNHFFRIGGRVKEVRFYNNIFYAPTIESFHILIITDFDSVEGGVGGKNCLEKLVASNNYVQHKGKRVPLRFRNTIVGDDPGFVDFAGFDLWLKDASPCAEAGALDAPMAAEFSPVRGNTAPGDQLKRPAGSSMAIGAFGGTIATKADGPRR